MFAEVCPDRQNADLFRNLHAQVAAGNPSRIAWGQTTVRVDGTPFWIEVEAHRIRQRELVNAAINRQKLGEITSRLEDLGLEHVETSEVRSGDRFLAYVVTGKLPR